jgi:hypothetical protein
MAAWQTPYRQAFAADKARLAVVASNQWENLYLAAREFFKDISDNIIKAIAKAGSPEHWFAAIDLSAEHSIRNLLECGVRPDKDPEKPIAGKKVYNAYWNHSKPRFAMLLERLKWEYHKNVNYRSLIIDLLRTELGLMTGTTVVFRRRTEEEFKTLGNCVDFSSTASEVRACPPKKPKNRTSTSPT